MKLYLIIISILLMILAYPVSNNIFYKYFYNKNKIELEKREIANSYSISGEVVEKNDNNIIIKTFIGEDVELKIMIEDSTKIFTNFFQLTKKKKIAQKDLSISDIEISDKVKITSKEKISDNLILNAKSINVYKE